jgi:hypothetical protein
MIMLFYLIEWVKEDNLLPVAWIVQDFQTWEEAFGTASAKLELYRADPHTPMDFTILEAPEDVSLDTLYANLIKEAGLAA